MKKFKKLLSVLLAVVMAFSCLAVMGSAYQEYENPGAYFYDSNDTPRSFLYTDEQRASFIVDMVDDLLKGAAIYTEVAGQKVDLRSLDATMDTISRLGTIISLGGLFLDLGILEKLDRGSVDTTKTTTANGCVTMLNTLLNILRDNADMIANDIIGAGKINLGTVINLGDMSGVEKVLGDLPEFLGGIIYGLGGRKITNGIGSDPKYPNSKIWDEWDTSVDGAKPNLDTIVQNLLFKLLTEPNNTQPTNDPTRNAIITNPEAFGATSAMIHQDENGYYYIYGTQNNAGKWVFTEESTTNDGSDKNDILQWKDDSSLVDGAAGEQLREIINLTEGDLYTMLEKAIPWAYNTFAGHNLDGQLRATLMQFCGAFNSGDVDEATKEELKTIVYGYKEMEDNADKDKSVLRNEFANTQGVAGNYNFLYIDLEGKEIGDKTSDSLYYVVEWGNSWQFYHVEYGENGENVNALFDLIDWEYQAPMWETIASEVGLVAGQSMLLHINDIVGAILKRAMPTLSWTAGTADNTLANNLTALAKLVIHNAKGEIWGDHYVLPDGFDSFTLEQLLVLIAGELLDMLMPQLVLPDDVASVEEVGAYALREFMAEIMPNYGSGWDAMITDAKALSGTAREDAFLNIVLNMGASTGAYYLQNLIGLGTVTDGANTTTVEAVPMGPDHEWKAILNYIIDWVIKTWVPGITTNVANKYPAAMSGTDPLDKLSAIFSTIAPTLVKTLGANTDSFPLDLNHVYDDLRLAFNGNFSELAKGLQRKASGTSANMEAMQALATLIKELFGGLGFDTVGTDWTTLSNLLDTAAVAEYPLTKLVGEYDKTNDALVKLVAPFLRALTDTRSIWLKPVLTVVLNFLGGLTSELKTSEFIIDGILPAYTGATSYTVEYSYELTTIGVKTYFNNGRYKTTAGALADQKTGFDGDYSIKFYEVRVLDEAGNVKASNNYNGFEQAANEAIADSIQITGVTEAIETYTLEQDYTIVAPDGSEGETLTYKASFIVTSLQNDALSQSRVETGSYTQGSDGSNWTSSGGSGCNAYSINFTGKWAFNWTNIYISEKEELSKAATPVLSMTDLSSEAHSKGGSWAGYHSYSKAWVWAYGTNTYNDDGSITINSDGGAESIIINDGATTVHDVWFKWAGNDSGNIVSGAVSVPADRVGAVYTGSTTYDYTGALFPMWAVETTVTRANFTDDYTQYKIQVPLAAHADMTDEKKGAKLDTSAMDRQDVATVTQYITLYNSYDLQAKLDAALEVDKENYDTTAAEWTAFANAIAYAKTQMYGQWQATQFQANHTINIANLPTGIPKDADGNNCEGYTQATVSTFKYAGDRLDEAMAALDNCRLEEDADSSADTFIAPSDPASELHTIYNYIMSVEENVQLKSHNYVLYRWFKFNDLKTALRNALNAATPPSGVAYNTLAGVALDNEGIEAVIDTIDDAKLKAIVETLVEAPTQEAIDAAAEALANYEQSYDLTNLNLQLQKMQTNERRLLPKYDSQQKYFLNDAITKYGNEAAGAYTAESYKIYSDALAAAQAANNSTTSNQYEIFSSRYELLVAYNNLIKADEAVDMEALKTAIADAQAIIAAIGTEGEYALADGATVESLEEAYKALVVAMGIETSYDGDMYYIGGNFSGEYALAQEGLITAAEQQAWVNSITDNVNVAVANFKAPVTAEPVLGGIDTGVVDTENGYVYGVVAGETDLTLFFTVENGSFKMVANEGGYTNGTGATLVVMDLDGKEVAQYTLVVFGDVNGDGAVTATDSATVEVASLGAEMETAVYAYAADVNGDGSITATDSATVEVASLGGEITVNPYAA